MRPSRAYNAAFVCGTPLPRASGKNRNSRYPIPNEPIAGIRTRRHAAPPAGYNRAPNRSVSRMNATTTNPTIAPMTNVKIRNTCSSRPAIKRRQNPAPGSCRIVFSCELDMFVSSDIPASAGSCAHYLVGTLSFIAAQNCFFRIGNELVRRNLRSCPVRRHFVYDRLAAVVQSRAPTLYRLRGALRSAAAPLSRATSLRAAEGKLAPDGDPLGCAFASRSRAAPDDPRAPQRCDASAQAGRQKSGFWGEFPPQARGWPVTSNTAVVQVRPGALPHRLPSKIV